MCANRIFLGESQHWSRAKMCFILVLGPTEKVCHSELTTCSTRLLVARHLSVWQVLSSAQGQIGRMYDVHVCSLFLCQTSCSWRQGYSGETGTLMTCDKGIQSWPSLKLSLDFLSFSHHFLSELSWQLLCGRKTLRCCFSMSLWSTVIQPRPVLPVVTSHDSFNMLLVSRDSAKYSSNVNLMICRCQLLLWFEMS